MKLEIHECLASVDRQQLLLHGGGLVHCVTDLHLRVIGFHIGVLVLLLRVNAAAERLDCLVTEDHFQLLDPLLLLLGSKDLSKAETAARVLPLFVGFLGEVVLVELAGEHSFVNEAEDDARDADNEHGADLEK